MSPFVKWIGIALLILGALLVGREYEKYLMRRVAEYRGLLALICHAEFMISRSLAYGKELWRGFSDDSLEKCELLPVLREGESLKNAFDKCKGKMSLTSEEKEKISLLFAGLGKGYAELELKTINNIKGSLATELKNEEDSSEKKLKIVRALLLGGALTIAIMGI